MGEVILGTGPRGHRILLIAAIYYFLNASLYVQHFTNGVSPGHQNDPGRQGRGPCQMRTQTDTQQGEVTGPGPSGERGVWQ